MMRRVYIAGPMRFHVRYNFPSFFVAEERLRAQGWDVVNPARLDLEDGFDADQLPADHDWSTLPNGMTFHACMARDIPKLVECDAIYLLRGWSNSHGAQVEYQVAHALGLHFMYEPHRIVGFCGYARVGKDEAGKQTGYSLCHYADRLKLDLRPAVHDMPKELARPVMVAYGAARRLQDPAYWVKRLALPETRNAAVCDVRYANEVEHVLARGGLVVRVHRPKHGPANEEEARSIAEIAATWPDMPSVVNDGTPDELGVKVRGLIEQRYAANSPAHTAGT